MTDYLEELLDNTEALLEQVRRLERSGSGPATEEAEGEASSSAFRSARGSIEERARSGNVKTGETLRIEKPRKEGERDAPDPGTGGGALKDGTLEPPERVPTPLEEKEQPENGSVLLEQLEPPERVPTSLEEKEQPENDSILLEQLEPPERIPTPLEEAEQPEDGSVLLEQLERLERAAASELGNSPASRSAAWREDGGWKRTAFPAGPDGARGEAVYSGVIGPAADNWTLGAGFPGTDAQPAEALRWAEQADRAFRRDSRRYDGSFYLY